MKRVLCMLAIALVLIVSAWDSADARLNPIGWRSVDRDNGEDHPWGGEQNIGPDPVPIRVGEEAQTFSISGFLSVDNFFFRLLGYYWISPRVGGTPEVITPTNPPSVEGTITTGEVNAGTTGSGNRSGN